MSDVPPCKNPRHVVRTRMRITFELFSPPGGALPGAVTDRIEKDVLKHLKTAGAIVTRMETESISGSDTRTFNPEA